MATEGLQIKIGADVQSAVTSLNTLNASLNKTTQTAANVGATGMNTLTKGTSQASAAIINFSRVASDAPFGIIGIANNIDPLVQSFVQLRKETGSGKAALAALTSSLAGGGGLIIGISLLTSALQFVQLGFSRWGASAKQTKEEQDKLKQGTDQLVTSVTKQRVEFEALVNIARNVANSEKERANALKRLNEILPDTIGQLNAQNIATAEGARITLQYIKAIEARATAELLINRIAENNVKLFDNRNNILSKSADIENRLIIARGNYNKALTATVPNYQVIEAYASDIENLENKRAEIQKEGRDIAQQVLNDNAKLRAEYERQLPAVNSLTVKNTQNSNVQTKTKNTTSDLTNLLKQYAEQLKGINWDEQNRQIDGTKKRLELAAETLKSLYVAGVKETSSAWIKVKSDFDKFQSDYDKFLRDQRLKEINEGVKELRTNIGSFSEKELTKGQENTIKGLQKVGAAFLANYELQQKGLKDLQKKNQELANTISGFLSPALEGVFESLVRGEDPFEALKNSVKQLIIELGKAVIKSLILKAVTSAIGGAAGGAAGQSLGLGTIRGDTFSFLLSRGR
jgi:hypothetical protein